MKKQDILSVISLFLAPVLVILLGLLLLINPDSASVLISKILGWGLTAIAVVTGIIALFSDRGRVGKLIGAAVLFGFGGVLLARPLLLASFAGRIIGLLLILDGVPDILNAHRRGVRFLMPVVVTALGIVLVLMPMTASRLVFSLCGLVVAFIGVAMLLDRIRKPRLNRGKDSNIIDV